MEVIRAPRRGGCGGCLLRGVGCLSQFLVLLVLALALYYGVYLFQRGPIPERPLVIAHRGGAALAPENTLAAFRRAIDLGVDMLEMDVQRSADGVLVVIHDTTVDRTTDGQGRVGELTLDQLRRLNAGNGEPIPTLEEVLDLAVQHGIPVMPEAKSPQLYPGLGPEIAQALAQAGLADRSVLQSFDPDTLEEVRAIAPEQPLCMLYGLGTIQVPREQPGQAQAICPMAEMVLLNPWIIREAHRRGQQVFVWFGVVEHPWTLRLLTEFGADGLIVDDPRALQEVLAGR